MSTMSLHTLDPLTRFSDRVSDREFHRILKSTGRVALVWNTRDRSDDFTYDYSELLLEASNQHPAVDRLVVSQALFARSQFCNARELVFSSDQPLDLDGLWGATNSRSYIPRTGETNRRLLNDLESLYQRYADDSGFVYVKHKTQVIIAEVRT